MNTIYTLLDQYGKQRYVGKTSRSLNARLQDHIYKAITNKEKNHRACWIRSMLAVGIAPTIVAIESCGDDWPCRERFWITEGKRLGWDLTNGNEGGEGGQNPSLETREKISLAHKGKIVSEATRGKISAARKGRKLNETHKAAIRASCAKGFTHSDEAIEKIRAAKIGNKATLGRIATDEQRENVKAAVNAWMSKRTAIRNSKGHIVGWKNNDNDKPTDQSQPVHP